APKMHRALRPNRSNRPRVEDGTSSQSSIATDARVQRLVTLRTSERHGACRMASTNPKCRQEDTKGPNDRSLNSPRGTGCRPSPPCARRREPSGAAALDLPAAEAFVV